MRVLLQSISYLALAALFLAPAAYLAGAIGHGLMKQAMLTATLAWFISAPLWIGRKADPESASEGDA